VTEYDEHVRDRDRFLTAKLAEDLIGTAAMQSAETRAEDAGFTLDADTFDSIAFICDRCDWFCSMDEANDAPNGAGWLCDQCNEENDDGQE
jgi:hypothetical protein